MLIALAIVALAGCATPDEPPRGSSPADNLGKANRDPEVHGDLQITVGRTT